MVELINIHIWMFIDILDKNISIFRIAYYKKLDSNSENSYMVKSFLDFYGK